jgi:3-hydroxyacyl-[acyl-carrier-protein] dehydratase
MLIDGLYNTETFTKTDGDLTARIRIDPGHEIFKGHFPGRPVMPGVCMIQIVKELTERALEKELFLSVASNVKFMAIINPETDPELVLELTISGEDDLIKVRNTTSFGDTVALKLSATFKIME